MADAVSDLLQQYYGTPDALAGPPMARPARAPQQYDMYGETAQPPRAQQLGQHNAIDRLLSLYGQPSFDALQQARQGTITPQEAAWALMTTGPFGSFGLTGTPRATSPTFERFYHGTADPAFRIHSAPIWSGNRRQAQFFALEGGGPGEPGAIAPLLVDTSNYLTIRPNSLLQAIDNRFGSANQLYRDGRNWVGDTASLLGYGGIRYPHLGRDHGSAILSLDPRTVRSFSDPNGLVSHAPPRPRLPVDD